MRRAIRNISARVAPNGETAVIVEQKDPGSEATFLEHLHSMGTLTALGGSSEPELERLASALGISMPEP